MTDEEKIKDLEEQLELLKGQRVSVWKFYAKKDSMNDDIYAIGLFEPTTKNMDYGFPLGYSSRGAFSKEDIKEIAHKLLKMIGE
jgi:hypothetical protein